MTNPTVSVVMAVFNGAAHLDEAITSIRQQTFTDFEFVIVNDGSTDDTAAILQRHAAEDPRLRILTQPNQGLTASLNRACREARGRYLARMDADDVALPDRLARQVAFLDAHPTVAAVGGAARCLRNGQPADEFIRHPTEPAAVARALRDYSALAHPTVMMRRQAFLDAGGYRFPHTEDYDLWLRLAERHELANLPDVVLLYRVHTGQKSFYGIIGTALMKAAARHCARVRQATGRDPLADATDFSHAALLRAGVPARELEQALWEYPVDEAAKLLRTGQAALAIPLLTEIYRLLSAQPSDRHRRSEVCLLLGKAHGAAGHRRASLGWFGRAYWLEPSRLWRTLRRRLAGPRSF